MKNLKPKTIMYRREREGKTNYRKRRKFLMSREARAVVRGSLNNMTVQIITYTEKGDVIVASANSRELQKKYQLKTHRGNIPSAYLTGLLCGKKALQKKVKYAVADIGMSAPAKSSRVYAAIKGMQDAGVEMNCSPDVAPSEEKIQGKDIENYAKKLKDNKAAYEKQFSSYIKQGVNPAEISKNILEVRNKIMG